MPPRPPNPHEYRMRGEAASMPLSVLMPFSSLNPLGIPALSGYFLNHRDK